ncbi:MULTISPECIES: class I SAM-dependent methyltransferase [unclassified Mycobacterium]|uniref:Eco57I restriction-modification methylase domain-containing protein n=1 Tax=unclassified Mycobacterium TaxID=2642494 RepID=UPI0007FDED7C|nr:MULTISPECIES: class I SAM-dependent methyltransferase [unclassified Mycobacterium]OBG59525.1 lactate dehydrogenase [Mycobacterium sp. E735]OBG71374.1 lactate dehydrogenase [Mycobacterium sp. E3305]OBG94961.1 lactate dehydrogenase [Mycobacterium sp. E3298]OBH15175.1 lactate dehydrogenase [Mycobacterium sp. E1715]
MRFAGKAAASADKARGGYYTPAPVARFLAGWVREAGPRIVEPSCGDGAILRELAALGGRPRGVELVGEEAAKARQFAPVDAANLFGWLATTEPGAWDGVAGNPPYIRFGNWAAEQREPALELMRRAGLRPSRLTNAWVPFVVASSILVRDGGRVGLVLPAELLQVTYAAQLREFLLSRFSDITLVTFERLVFDGILQEVVLFCGVAGAGPARIRTLHLTDADALARAALDVDWAPALLHENEKWTKYFLRPDAIRALRTLKGSAAMTRLGSVADVDVGIVTGRNSFFTFTDAQARELALLPHCVPLVSRSAQLSGLFYDTDCRAGDVAAGRRTWLLDAPREPDDPALIAHIRAGESAGVHRGYKCSIRKPWWSTPSPWVPDLFLLRQIHLAPRLTVNAADATSTDTVHRVRLSPGVEAAALATAFHNSVTFAFAEIIGRSYGGGILELEPREAEQLPIPPPALAGPGLAGDVDLLLKANEIDKALDLVDRHVLIDRLGLQPEVVARCRAAWASLRDRRKRRGAR